MIMNIIGIILIILPIALAIWVIETYFPNLQRALKAFIIASITIAVIRLFYQWTCQLLCGPLIP
jgi:uncharacterized membrane protein